MKYVIIGGAGNISRPLAENLLRAGHTVTVVGRNADHLSGLVDMGARAAIGSVEDSAFLKKTFAEADAVYTMIPPNYSLTSDWKSYIEQIGKNYAAALSGSRVKYVVNLSSVGADQPAGCGPVTGLHRVEKVLDTLSDINIKHLRPAYFYQNFLSNVDQIKQAGIMGGNFSIPEGRFPLADPRDISEIASYELLRHDFKGHSHQYIASDEVGTSQVAAVIGKAIGKQDLRWVQFPDADALAGLKQAGFPEEIATNFVEMGKALADGRLMEDYWKNRPQERGKIKLEDFAREFAAFYNAN